MQSVDRVRQRFVPRSTVARFTFGIALVAVATLLRLLLAPLTGAGAPYFLYFSAALVTALVAGVGPAILTLAISVPLATMLFVVPAGYSVAQVAVQAMLYVIDGFIVVYVTVCMARRRRRLQQVEVELRRANEERSRALARVSDAIEHAPDAYILAGPDTRLTEVNEAACRLIGLERGELVGRSIVDLIVPEERERIAALRAESRAPGTILTTVWTLLGKDGRRIPVEASTNSLPDGRWQGFVRDITEARRIAEEREALLARERSARQQAESTLALLRESEERFRLIVDEAPIGMALVSLDGHFVRVNHALCDITGYSADELTQLTFQEITHPDDLDSDVEAAARLTRGEVPRYQREKRYIRKDGAVVDIMLSVSLLRTPDEGARYFISQMEDITARKRADAALRFSEAMFSGIVSISTDAIISVDARERITIFNEGAELIFGYTKEEAIGMPLERLIPERFREAHHGHIARFAAGEEVARTMGPRREIFGLRKNGEEFPAEASISKVTVGGEPFFSVVMRDATSRKRVEAELQAAINARDQVLGIVAHDLRNPLQTIMMQASLLQREDTGPERRDQTPRLVIERSATRMNRLIQDLLDVARAEAGKLRIERQRLSAADLAREAVESHASLATSAQLELRLEVKGLVGDVIGDRHRLLQVLDNLIGNALKFTPRGGRVVVETCAEEGSIVFAVSDTGPGIASESVAHIFEPFWQAATRSRRLGAGLGLPISKGVVEAHGGRIWVKSSPDRGTTFAFAIPAAPPEGVRANDPRFVHAPTQRIDRTRNRRQRS